MLCEIISVQEAQEKKCTFTVSLRRVRVTIVRVEKQ